MSVTALLDQIDLSEAQQNWLVVDAPGEEAVLIDALVEGGRLTSFQTVGLICGQRPLYEGSTPAQTIRACLEEIGYRIEIDMSDIDPDWLNCRFRYMPLAFQRDLAQAEMTALKAELAEAWDQIEAAQTQIEGEYQARTEAEAALEAADVARAKLEVDLAAEAQIELAELKQHNDTLQKDLRIAQRLQTIARSDLLDLQTQYTEMHRVKRAQEELLLRLNQRLGIVAGDLHRQTNPEITAAHPVSQTKAKPRASSGKKRQ